MHLFANYIQPLTLWLYAHPHLALLITFLISFSESLAIVGSIIPGSVTMTAIGILAGSGVMRIDLTFLAATLGAIAGDSGSYALGYTFSDRLINIWPFKNYPGWLNYGQEYFAKHGATSVLIGRFIGPMRSIIPVIAGMMHMSHLRFFFANVVSAVAWAILYVTPGILIGAASSELSTESATRLFILILILLVIIWLASLAIKWLLIHANQLLRTNLHNLWMRLKHRPRLAYFAKVLAPQEESNHYPTAALVFLAILSFCVSLITIGLVLQGSWVAAINNPVYLFFQSLRTAPFDSFFIAVGLVISPLSLFALLATLAIYILASRDWRTLRYGVSLALTSGIIIFLLTTLVDTQEPIGPATDHTRVLFPDTNLTFATSLFGFLALYMSTYYRTVIMLVLRVLLLSTLCLAGIALVYLGDNWITNVIASYFIGLTLCLMHWIFYRRGSRYRHYPQLPIILSFIPLIVATYGSYFLYFKQISSAHSHPIAQYVITDQVWWSQKKPLLPIYSTNRIGKRASLLNIQYVGSINKLQQTLEGVGWKQQPDSFFYSLLIRAGGKNSAELPLLAQLYKNKKPTLVMTYSPSDAQTIIVLRLWRSNYHIRHHRQPIWLGSVERVRTSSNIKLMKKNRIHPPVLVPDYMTQALHGFKFNQVRFPRQYLHALRHPTSPILLLIKEKEIEETSGNKEQ